VISEPSSTERTDVLCIALGPLATAALAAGQRCEREGIAVRVVAPTWVAPLPPALIELAKQSRLVVTAEDGGLNGGFGAGYARALRESGSDATLLTLGLEQEFVAVGKRVELLKAAGLDAAGLYRSITGAVARLDRDRDDTGSDPAMGTLVEMPTAKLKTGPRSVDPATHSGPS
jgi:1-deoxy-D-xylulose-5-phosphate synthase